MMNNAQKKFPVAKMLANYCDSLLQSDDVFENTIDFEEKINNIVRI